MVGQPNNYKIYTTKTEYFFCNQRDTDVDAPLWQQAIPFLNNKLMLMGEKPFPYHSLCIRTGFENIETLGKQCLIAIEEINKYNKEK